MAGAQGKGHDGGAAHARTRQTPRGDLAADRSIVVQEEIARLEFFAGIVEFSGMSVLDLGSGTGFSCGYSQQKLGSGRALGVDISAPTVALARKAFPGARFEVGDACDPTLSFDPGSWDRVLCCEVFEHVQQPGPLLETVARHIAGNGVALITTPNRPVFSLDHEPSPINQTHLREYTLDEFHEMLESRFSQVTIYGQRFSSQALFCRRQAIVRRSIKDFRFLGRHYWGPLTRRLWKAVRLEPLWRLLEGRYQYDRSSFEFVEPVSADSIWLCAVVRK